MTLENLFETAPRQAEVSALLPRAFRERTSKPAGYLVVGLHTRDFLDITTYHVRDITSMTREEGGTKYHDNGVVHTILKANFSVDAVIARAFCFSGEHTPAYVLQKLRHARDSGYSFSYDFSTLDITAANGHTSVVIPSDQFVRDTHYRSAMVDYIRRTKEGALVLPCPTLYYTTSPDEAQKAVQLLKQQALEFR